MSSHDNDYARVMTVVEWLNKGFSRNALHVLINEKFDLKTPGSRNKLIKKALTEISNEVDIDFIVKHNGERLDLIIGETMKKGNYSAAIKAIEASNRMYGIYNEKKEVNINADNITVRFGDAD